MSTARSISNRRRSGRAQSDSSEKSLDKPIHLNVHEEVQSVTEKAFPWSADIFKDKQEWPYILQPPLQPKRYKRKNILPEKKFQTEKKFIIPKIPTAKSKVSSLKETFLWEPPEESLSIVEQNSFVSVQSGSSSKTMMNMDILCKKIESKSRFLETNTLPLYVLNKSFTSIPKWVEKNVPEYIKPGTIIQAGKPWHKINECTWAMEAKNITPFQPTTSSQPIPNKTSPKVDWGPSACSLQKKKFDTEYHKARKKKEKHMKSVSIHRKMSDKDKSCKAHFYHHIAKKKVLEPIILPIDAPSIRSPSPSESLGDVTCPLDLTQGIYSLSYAKKDDQKKKYTRPAIDGIEKHWEYLTERKWPSNIATTTLFNSLAKPKSDTPIIDNTKYPIYGQWPYVENMVKTMNTSTGTFKIRKNFSFDSNFRKTFSSNRNLEYTNKNRKKRTSSITIPTIFQSIRKPDEYNVNHKQQNNITELVLEEEITPSTLNQQKMFPGFIESQATFIKPDSMEAPFIYQLSNLHLYELNYTYLMQKEKFLKTLIYYSTFNNKTTHDPFQIITTKRYSNKVPYLDVPSSGPAKIYYPNGKVAIQCAYSCIENRSDLLTRRYTIRSESTQRVAAVFDSLGNGIVYDKIGTCILNYSQNFGVHIENQRLYKWRWHNIPVTDDVYTEEIDILLKPSNIPNTEIEEMVLRNVNLYDRSLQFGRPLEDKSLDKSLDSNNSLPEQNPVAYKSNGDINYGVVTPFKSFTVQINEYMKLYVKDQKHVELKFHANDVKLSIQLGVLLNPQIVLGRDSIDYHLIPYGKIVCKFDKIVGETESLVKILKYVGDGKKLHPLKYKTQLIDFNDKVVNLIEDDTCEDKLKNSFDLIQLLSDDTLRVKNTKDTAKKMKNNDPVLNKSKNEYNILKQSTENEKISEIDISKFYHSDNVLEGSNPIASNVSLLINNKVKLKQFLTEIKHYRK